MKKVISLYTGAGGLDLGLEAAGFETGVAVEFNKHACRTLRANSGPRRNWSIVEADIHEVASKDILTYSNCKVGQADILIGGPPCQPFSKSAYWARGDTKRLDDPRADTLSAYLRVLRDTQPRAFILENVFGLAYKGKDEALHLLRDTVDKINREVGTEYSFSWKILNAADYGVPQIRERFFLVGLRDGRDFKFPETTHSEAAENTNGNGVLRQTTLVPLDEGPQREQWRTAWDAIGDLELEEHPELRATGKWADLLPTIPEGENYLWHTDRKGGHPIFGWRSRYWSFLLKLAKSKPSWTIQAQPGAGIGPFHWKNRRLSSREMMRIQTFPDDYQLVGGHTEIQRQIGNAVPSLIGEILGRELMILLHGDSSSSTAPLTLLPKSRTPVPRAHPRRPVPTKYLSGLKAN